MVSELLIANSSTVSTSISRQGKSIGPRHVQDTCSCLSYHTYGVLEGGDKLVMHIKVASQNDTLFLGHVVTQRSDKVHDSYLQLIVQPPCAAMPACTPSSFPGNPRYSLSFSVYNASMVSNLIFIAACQATCLLTAFSAHCMRGRSQCTVIAFLINTAMHAINISMSFVACVIMPIMVISISCCTCPWWKIPIRVHDVQAAWCNMLWDQL